MNTENVSNEEKPNGVLPDVSGSFLKSLRLDLAEMKRDSFLTSENKQGLAIAISQIDRYINGDLKLRNL